jgi:hypothetical protein
VFREDKTAQGDVVLPWEMKYFRSVIKTIYIMYYRYLIKCFTKIRHYEVFWFVPISVSLYCKMKLVLALEQALWANESYEDANFFSE